MIERRLFSFRLKQGDGGVWTEEKLGVPRYFYYWQPEPLKKLLVEHGFKIVNMTDVYTGSNEVHWLQFIARKVSR